MKYFLYAVLLIPFYGTGQVTLTLKNAIDTTLKNSYDIRIANNNVSINSINNTFGMAGGLPVFSASITDNQSNTNVNQKLNSGSEIKKSATSGNSMASSVTGSILLYNGMRVSATKERLSRLQAQSELELNIEVQNSISFVMSKFYDIIRQQEYLKILQTSLGVSQNKLEIVTQRKNVGMANDADFLQAKIDENAAEQSINSQKLIVEQAKTDLLSLMSKKQYYPFSVNDSISIDRSLQLENILNYLKKNPEYLAAEQQIRINEQVVKEVNALRYPTLKFTTNYNLNRTQSSAGLYLLNQSYGPYAGLSLQIPIYNGNIYKIQKETAVFNVSNSKLQQESLHNTLLSDAMKTFQSYSTNLEQLDSQEKTIQMSGKLIDVVMQRFRLNQATILDVKAAQASYEDSGYQLVNLKYAAKLAEIELKRLTYQLSN